MYIHVHQTGNTCNHTPRKLQARLITIFNQLSYQVKTSIFLILTELSD